MKNKPQQTAVITGASSGIGLGLTKAFLAEGFKVVANARRVTSAGTLTPSDDLLLVDGDVGDSSTAHNLINIAEQRFTVSACCEVRDRRRYGTTRMAQKRPFSKPLPSEREN
jgi:NADP-dependent 3-hydroxy acid dehydrogenase YdfG